MALRLTHLVIARRTPVLEQVTEFLKTTRIAQRKYELPALSPRMAYWQDTLPAAHLSTALVRQPEARYIDAYQVFMGPTYQDPPPDLRRLQEFLALEKQSSEDRVAWLSENVDHLPKVQPLVRRLLEMQPTYRQGILYALSEFMLPHKADRLLDDDELWAMAMIALIKDWWSRAEAPTAIDVLMVPIKTADILGSFILPQTRVICPIYRSTQMSDIKYLKKLEREYRV